MLVRYFALLIFCSVYIYSFGQYAGRGSKDISKILSKNDTILFILSGDEKFDNNLMYSIENHWTFSPWDTMSIQKRKDINLKGYKSSQLVLVFNVLLLFKHNLPIHLYVIVNNEEFHYHHLLLLLPLLLYCLTLNYHLLYISMYELVLFKVDYQYVQIQLQLLLEVLMVLHLEKFQMAQ